MASNVCQTLPRGLRFEAEQANARADRLQRRMDQLFRGAPEPGGGGGGSAVAKGGGRRVQELEAGPSNRPLFTLTGSIPTGRTFKI